MTLLLLTNPVNMRVSRHAIIIVMIHLKSCVFIKKRAKPCQKRAKSVPTIKNEPEKMEEFMEHFDAICL